MQRSRVEHTNSAPAPSSTPPRPRRYTDANTLYCVSAISFTYGATRPPPFAPVPESLTQASFHASWIPLLADPTVYPAACAFAVVTTIVPLLAPGVHVPPVTGAASGVPFA